MSYLAVIDLGSNSTRMVVEELQADGTFVELKRRKLDTRLAEGMDQNAGELTEAAMTRVVEALIEFRDDYMACLLYTSPSPRDGLLSRMPSSAWKKKKYKHKKPVSYTHHTLPQILH